MTSRVLKDILERLQRIESNATRYRQGVITAISPLSVALGGSTVSYTSVKALPDCGNLAVDDVVSVLTFGNDLIILGRVTDGATALYTRAPFEIDAGGPNIGQLTIAPTATTSPEGVAQLTLVPNDPATASVFQDRTALIAFHPERSHIEDATIKCHRHLSGVGGSVTDRHIQIHTKNAAGTNIISRFEIQYMTDDAFVLITSAHLEFDTNAYIAPRNAGDKITFKNATHSRINVEIEDTGVIHVVGDGTIFAASAAAGSTHTVPTVCDEYLTIRNSRGLFRKVPCFLP